MRTGAAPVPELSEAWSEVAGDGAGAVGAGLGEDEESAEVLEDGGADVGGGDGGGVTLRCDAGEEGEAVGEEGIVGS